MKFSFKPDYGLIYVRVIIAHSDREAILNLALDTGASATIISAKKLVEVGYDLDKPEDEIYITTGSGLIFVPKIRIGLFARKCFENRFRQRVYRIKVIL